MGRTYPDMGDLMFQKIDLRAPGAIEALLAMHRQHFGDLRMEADPEPTPTPQPDPQPEPKEPDTGDKDPSAEVEKWKALARKHEANSKANADAARRLAELEESSKTDAEKAVAAARKEGEQAARSASAPKLVRAEFKAAAAGRLTKEQLDGFLEDLDLNKYLTEDGEVDEERVAKKVDLLAPPADPQRPPSFNGGPRAPEPKRAGSLGEAIQNRLANKP